MATTCPGGRRYTRNTTRHLPVPCDRPSGVTGTDVIDHQASLGSPTLVPVGASGSADLSPRIQALVDFYEVNKAAAGSSSVMLKSTRVEYKSDSGNRSILVNF